MDLPFISVISVSLRSLQRFSDINISLKKLLNAALEWIKKASSKTGNVGISKGYDLISARWAPAYPDTTGYMIPTLLNAAKLINQAEFNKLTYNFADHLLNNITQEGGVTHW